MFDFSKSYGFDEEAAKAGVKMFVGGDEEYFLIRKLPNPDYNEELLDAFQKNSKILEHLKKQDKDEYNKMDRKIQAGVLAKTCVIGWGKGISDNGKAIPYSVEACKEFLFKYPDFRSECVEFANNKDNYPIEGKLDSEDVVKK